MWHAGGIQRKGARDSCVWVGVWLFERSKLDIWADTANQKAACDVNGKSVWSRPVAICAPQFEIWYPSANAVSLQYTLATSGVSRCLPDLLRKQAFYLLLGIITCDACSDVQLRPARLRSSPARSNLRYLCKGRVSQYMHLLQSAWRSTQNVLSSYTCVCSHTNRSRSVVTYSCRIVIQQRPCVCSCSLGHEAKQDRAYDLHPITPTNLTVTWFSAESLTSKLQTYIASHIHNAYSLVQALLMFRYKFQSNQNSFDLPSIA